MEKEGKKANKKTRQQTRLLKSVKRIRTKRNEKTIPPTNKKNKNKNKKQP